MSLPVVRLEGSPHEQGVAHGEALRDRIAHNLDVYFTRFEREAHLPKSEVLWRAELYLERLGRQSPGYLELVRGIAAGSGLPLLELAALNVRYEILYHQYTAELTTDGCTAFAVAPELTASGHLLMGQNWDWIPEVQGAVLHTVHPDGLETLAFTEAGIAGGKIGLNSAGLGLAINGLLSTADDWSRLRKPFHVRCYEILRSWTLDAAVAVVESEPRSCSTNFLFAQAPDRMLDLEAAPEIVGRLEAEGGCLVHANHFVDAEGLGVREPWSDRRPYSCHRRERLGELLRSRAPLTVPDIQECLRDHADHPNGLCRHPDTSLPQEQRSITVASAIMDLVEKTLWITEHQPCLSEYQEVRLD
jgi:isopenicillin-N N-acyltransferase-like protein